MVTTQLKNEIEGFDERILMQDSDFTITGLRQSSLVRVARLAVLNRACLAGVIGYISEVRLNRIYLRLGQWLGGLADSQ